MCELIWAIEGPAFNLEFLTGIVDAVPDHSERVSFLDFSLVPEAPYPT